MSDAKYERFLYLLKQIKDANITNKLDILERAIEVEWEKNMHWTEEELEYIKNGQSMVLDKVLK